MVLLSADGHWRFVRQQGEGLRFANDVFYSEEDRRVLQHRYLDARIGEFVLTAFERWSRPVSEAGADWERALQVLRESPDPKTDNLLALVFRRSAYLPLSPAAEELMFKAMLDRNSDSLWESLERAVASPEGGAAAQTRRLL